MVPHARQYEHSPGRVRAHRSRLSRRKVAAMTRPAHAEKKAARKAAKTFLRSLAPAAQTAYLAMEPGDEAVVFMPSGEMAHLLREDEVRFRVRELEDFDAA